MKFYQVTVCYLLVAFVFFLNTTFAANSGDKYQKGYYIDSLNHPVEGFIAFDGSTSQSFTFKKQLGDQATKITVDQCSGFHIGSRVFTVINDIDFVILIRKRPLKKAFVELVEEGNVNLYKLSLQWAKTDRVHKAASTASKMSESTIGISDMMDKVRIFYFVKKADEKTYTKVEHKKSHLKPQLEDYLNKDPSIVKKIETNKDYAYNNIEAIIHEYNDDMQSSTAK